MNDNTLLLARHPFFERLSERHLEMLLEDAMPVAFQANEIIFKEGESANRFYLLLSGEVVLESRSPAYEGEGKPVLIDTLREGDVLGWSWMFPPHRWHFDARAASPVKAIFFYGTRLKARCEKDCEFGLELMSRATEVAISRLQATRRRLLEVADALQNL